MIQDKLQNLLLRSYNKKVERIQKKIKELKLQNNINMTELFSVARNNDDLILMFSIISILINKYYHIEVYNEQLLGALLMCDGYVIDMKTGEGKTIVAIYVAAIRALKGQVHVITVNDYLAKRDYEYSNNIFSDLGVTSGFNYSGADKEKLFSNMVIYTSSTEIVFDYLRSKLPNHIQLKLDNVIIDEIDYCLIDNANTSCSISYNHAHNQYLQLFYIAYEISNFLVGYEKKKVLFNNYAIDSGREGYDYSYQYHEHGIEIYESGVNKIKSIINKDIFCDKKLLGALQFCLEAKHFFIKDKDYKVINNKVSLINRENGRVMYNCTYSDEIQLAIEIKEGCDISSNHGEGDNIMYQIYYNKYSFLTGMSGTSFIAREEFYKIFNKNVIKVPTHLKCRRKDLPDIITKTIEDKYCVLLKTINYYKEHNNNPIVVVCGSDSEANFIYESLMIQYPSKLLTNDNIEEEVLHVQDAGQKNSLLITTNIVGRGTDIDISNISCSGGLVVISLARYANKRIDEQVMGRAGRHGKEGISQFIISLEDDLFRNVDIKLIQPFLNLKDDRFHTCENQKKLSNLTRYVQSVIENTFYKTRTMHYQFEYAADILKCALRSSKYEQTLIEGIIKENICNKEFLDHYTFLGSIKTRLIMSKIFHYILEYKTYEYHQFYTWFKEDINLRMYDEYHLYTEYVMEIVNYIQTVEQYIKTELLNNYMTVKILNKTQEDLYTNVRNKEVV